jgi:recombinational DNA repair protein RecT
MSNADTITFFTSLQKMATSGVPPEEESGYAARIALLKKYNP